MHLQRIGKNLVASNYTEAESTELTRHGFQRDTTLDKLSREYNEDVLHDIAALPGVTLDELLFAFLVPYDQYKDRPRTILPSRRFDEHGLEPMDHQALWNTLLLEQGRFLLRGETGTGKSKPAVDVTSYLMNIGRVNITLIVTETTPVDQWTLRHIPADSYFKAVSLLGSKAERIRRLRAGIQNGVRYFTINYDGVKVIKDELKEVLNSESALILDESQNVKRHVSETFKVIYELIREKGIRWVFLLSATPLTQSPEDIFGQAAMIDKRLFGAPADYNTFKTKYMIAIPSGVGPNINLTLGYKNMDDYMPRVHSIMDSVRKSVLNLPPAFYEVLDFDLPPQLRRLYDDYIKTDGILTLPGQTEPLFVADHPFAATAKARQMVNNWIYKQSLIDEYGEEVDTPIKEAIVLFPEIVSNEKMDYICHEAHKDGESAIIYYEHKADRLIIEKALIESGLTYVRIDGDVDAKARWGLMEKFQNLQVQIFMGQTRSVRTGVELTRAKKAYYFNNGYSVNNRIQSEGRPYRKGVDHSVIFYDLRWKATIEVYMYHALQQKWDISKSIMDGENLERILAGEIWL